MFLSAYCRRLFSHTISDIDMHVQTEEDFFRSAETFRLTFSTEVILSVETLYVFVDSESFFQLPWIRLG